MKPENSKSNTARIAGFLVGVFVALTYFSVAQADDRELLGRRARPPYVFILFDTSGSMNWNVGEAELPFLRSDSEDSKMYQAKAALYQVVSDLNGVNFGFASFNQNSLRIRRKHWMYELVGDGITLLADPATGAPLYTYPQQGELHTFGQLQNCSSSSSNIGCFQTTPAKLFDEWETRRMQMRSKLGSAGSSGTTFFIRADQGFNQFVYSVFFDDTGIPVRYGDPTITVRVRIRGVGHVFDQTRDLTFRLMAGGEDGFVSVDFGANRSTPTDPNGRQLFFSYADVFTSGTCNGWEGNSDSGSDSYRGGSEPVRINLKAVTDNSDTSLDPLRRYGDVIPLNWEDDNRAAILDRLAPNRLLLADPGMADLPSFVPDFGITPFLKNLPDPSNNNKLDLIDGVRAKGGTVLLPRGRTPLGNSLANFRTWFTGWQSLAANGLTGDPDWGCRDVFVLMLTDGLETCSSNGPAVAGSLLLDGVKTYVVGFGVPESATEDSLDEIALAGGTEAIRPQSVDELVDSLTDVFNEIQSQTAAFSSAAVPSVQTNVADKVFLTRFTSVKDSPRWDGHIDAFLKPVPLNPDATPDRTRRCGPNDTAACLVWDAGEELVEQSLTETELNAALASGATVTPVGTAEELRRIYYTPGAPSAVVPEPLDFFWEREDSTDEAWRDLLIALDLPTDTIPTTLQKIAGAEIVRDTLKIRDITIPVEKPDGTTEIQQLIYVLGDIFHSDPLVLSSPNDFSLFSVDFQGNGKPCDDVSEPNPGYRCFFEKHLYRRKMLIVGSNDGQVHSFDAGILRERSEGGVTFRRFDNGTGRELFSILTRSATPTLQALAQEGPGARHRFTADGPLSFADVFIDPVHNGTPTATQREWRTVVVSSQREGGRSVFALDVTQPDVLGDGIDPTSNDDLGNIPQPLGGTDGAVDDYVPSCSEGGVGCGPVAFPAKLWEFTDTTDLDNNDLEDLGDTWSTPIPALIQVRVGTEIEDRWVAIFGGGIDPDFVESDGEATSEEDLEEVEVVGNWLYMVDIETGQLLYKRRVDGAVPSEIAVADLNQDLYADSLYFGTTSGFLYKVSLTGTPDLEALTNPTTEAEREIWEPFKVFDTGSRPIFYPPAVINVAEQGKFALAFGTGDREDLWRLPNGSDGRFFMVIDDDFVAGEPSLPLDQGNLTEVLVGDPQTADNLLAGGGWFMVLRSGERQISTTFAIAGVTIFTTYKPDVPNPQTGPSGERVCSATGQSRVYIVFTDNANPIRTDSTTEQRTRFLSIAGFVTNPFLELTGTKNRLDGNPDDPENPDDDPLPDPGRTSDDLTDELRDIMNEIKTRFPDVCRFTNRPQGVKLQTQNTQQILAAPIPICTVQHSWREL